MLNFVAGIVVGFAVKKLYDAAKEIDDIGAIMDVFRHEADSSGIGASEDVDETIPPGSEGDWFADGVTPGTMPKAEEETDSHPANALFSLSELMKLEEEKIKREEAEREAAGKDKSDKDVN